MQMCVVVSFENYQVEVHMFVNFVCQKLKFHSLHFATFQLILK